MKKITQKRLLIKVVKKIEKIFKQQEQIILRYEEIEKKQRNQEFWIKTTRYLAFAFIVVRIAFFCYSNFI